MGEWVKDRQPSTADLPLCIPHFSVLLFFSSRRLQQRQWVKEQGIKKEQREKLGWTNRDRRHRLGHRCERPFTTTRPSSRQGSGSVLVRIERTTTGNSFYSFVVVEIGRSKLFTISSSPHRQASNSLCQYWIELLRLKNRSCFKWRAVNREIICTTHGPRNEKQLFSMVACYCVSVELENEMIFLLLLMLLSDWLINWCYEEFTNAEPAISLLLLAEAEE